MSTSQLSSSNHHNNYHHHHHPHQHVMSCHDEKVGVSDDVEVGGSMEQRASWNASLGVRSS